jgi:hypothetical protein
MKNPFKRWHGARSGALESLEALVPQVASLLEMLPDGVRILVGEDRAALLHGERVWP